MFWKRKRQRQRKDDDLKLEMHRQTSDFLHPSLDCPEIDQIFSDMDEMSPTMRAVLEATKHVAIGLVQDVLMEHEAECLFEAARAGKTEVTLPRQKFKLNPNGTGYSHYSISTTLNGMTINESIRLSINNGEKETCCYEKQENGRVVTSRNLSINRR